MPIWEHYKYLEIEKPKQAQIKRRYSITTHVLSFKRCSKQYGFIVERKYEPALMVQMYYGTIIHQVLDRAHQHFAGLMDPKLKNSIPSDKDIIKYFTDVENSLKAQKIYAVRNLRDSAMKVLKRFNRIEGPHLYKRIIDTEFRLQTDQEDYILHGNVDVLAQAEKKSKDFNEYEIWDYKGTKKPSRSEPIYDDYIFQMSVYAELYRQRTGYLPIKGILYFLNELSGDPAPKERPIDAVMEIKFDEEEIDKAMKEFTDTIYQIESCKNSGMWPDPVHPPQEETCDACDFRWNCMPAKRFGRSYKMLYP